MPIVGLGTDIVEISRLDTKNNAALARRILTDQELAIWHAHKQPLRYLAKRWAAKEAAAKAVGFGIANGVSFKNFEILNNAHGAPILRITGRARSLIGETVSAHLSLSDERHYASATVILESH